MQAVYVFEDGRGELGVQTDLRSTFDVRTGAFTLVERLLAEGTPARGLFARDGLIEVTRERHQIPVDPDLARGADAPAAHEPIVLLNGRLLRSPGQLIAATLAAGAGSAITHEGDVLAACVVPAQAGDVREGRVSGLRRIDLAQASAALITPMSAGGPVLMSRPWHARLARDMLLRHDLALLIRAASSSGAPPARQGSPGVWTAGSAKVHASAIFDSEAGPIYVDEQAVVRPGAILIGPVYVGPHSTVLERATIRPNTSIGPWCKVNGEVGGTILQAYSNKAHDGYLGDSWIGEWVNFGAGTTNSNLLNTYGEVLARATPEGRTERTGEAFVGAMVGDHVKTAIGTRIMTGSVIGTGAMIATTTPASGCIPAFAWCTDEGRTRYRLDKFVEVMCAAMKRRAIEPSVAYLRRLEEIYSTRRATESHGV